MGTFGFWRIIIFIVVRIKDADCFIWVPTWIGSSFLGRSLINFFIFVVIFFLLSCETLKGIVYLLWGSGRTRRSWWISEIVWSATVASVWQSRRASETTFGFLFENVFLRICINESTFSILFRRSWCFRCRWFCLVFRYELSSKGRKGNRGKDEVSIILEPLPSKWNTKPDHFSISNRDTKIDSMLWTSSKAAVARESWKLSPWLQVSNRRGVPQSEALWLQRRRLSCLYAIFSLHFIRSTRWWPFQHAIATNNSSLKIQL